MRRFRSPSEERICGHRLHSDVRGVHVDLCRKQHPERYGQLRPRQDRGIDIQQQGGPGRGRPRDGLLRSGRCPRDSRIRQVAHIHGGRETGEDRRGDETGLTRGVVIQGPGPKGVGRKEISCEIPFRRRTGKDDTRKDLRPGKGRTGLRPIEYREPET